MLSNKTKLIAKIDPLKYLLSRAALIGRTAKWVMLLSEFYIEYVDRKEIKGQVIEDQLVDAPLQGDHPILTKFLDESIMPRWIYNDYHYVFHLAVVFLWFLHT